MAGAVSHVPYSARWRHCARACVGAEAVGCSGVRRSEARHTRGSWRFSVLRTRQLRFVFSMTNTLGKRMG